MRRSSLSHRAAGVCTCGLTVCLTAFWRATVRQGGCLGGFMRRSCPSNEPAGVDVCTCCLTVCLTAFWHATISQGGGSGGFMRRSWLSNEPAGVDVWTGPLSVLVEGPGLYRTHRTDMIIGAW
jgi:hypothetical protein